MLRSVRNSDAAALAELYNYYILHTAYTLEVFPVSAEEFAARIARISAEFPYLVYADDETGEALGYAYLTRFHERYAYRFAVDLSIYVAPQAKRRGIGTQLFEAIRTQAIQRGYFRLISIVTDENTASCQFHLRHGFAEMGHLSRVAWKFEHWLGVYHYCLTLQEGNPGEKI